MEPFASEESFFAASSFDAFAFEVSAFDKIALEASCFEAVDFAAAAGFGRFSATAAEGLEIGFGSVCAAADARAALDSDPLDDVEAADVGCEVTGVLAAVEADSDLGAPSPFSLDAEGERAGVTAGLCAAAGAFFSDTACLDFLFTAGAAVAVGSADDDPPVFGASASLELHWTPQMAAPWPWRSGSESLCWVWLRRSEVWLC